MIKSREVRIQNAPAGVTGAEPDVPLFAVARKLTEPVPVAVFLLLEYQPSRLPGVDEALGDVMVASISWIVLGLPLITPPLPAKSISEVVGEFGQPVSVPSAMLENLISTWEHPVVTSVAVGQAAVAANAMPATVFRKKPV